MHEALPEHGVFDFIEAKMPWMKGKIIWIQQDGAKPHTKKGTVRDLEKAGSSHRSVQAENRWTVKIYTQPPSSPDLNVNDLGFFASLKSECRDMETYVLERDRMMDMVMIKFQEYCSKKLERIWACLFNNFRSIMKVRGKNDYRQAHNDGRKRQNRGESPIDLTVDMDDYNECKRLIARFRAQNPA